MTAAREIGDMLAEQLDAIQPQLDLMAEPFEHASVLQERIDVAVAYLHDQACTGGVLRRCRCLKHYLIDVLTGEEL